MNLTHYYGWKNNLKRAELFNSRRRVLAQGRMNSTLIEFENGQKEIVSRRSIKKVK